MRFIIIAVKAIQVFILISLLPILMYLAVYSIQLFRNGQSMWQSFSSVIASIVSGESISVLIIAGVWGVVITPLFYWDSLLKKK